MRKSLLAIVVASSVVSGFAVGCGGDEGTGGSGGTGTTTSSSSTGVPVEPAFSVQSVSASAGHRQETEATVAISKDGVVAAAWIGQTTKGGLDIGYTLSQDRGHTWSAPAVASPGGTDLYGDPTLVATADGGFYLAFLSFDAGFTQGAIWVAHAAPGATAFDPAVRVTPANEPGPYDKPIVALTESQAVLVSYTNTSNGALDLARSTDGATFTRTHVIPTSAVSLPYVCSDVGGQHVWIVYHLGSTIQMRWSDDDGVTFPAANRTVVSLNNELDISTDDTICVGKGDEVWIGYSRSKDMTNSSNFLWKDYVLRLAHSADGGHTIDRRADVNDASASMFTMEPALALEADGSIDLAYLAGNAENDPMGSLRVGRSTDGGQSFAPSTALYSPVTFGLSRTAPNWVGDYFGFVWDGGRVLSAFADNQSGTSHVSFASAPAATP
jgi:hypothetical protein